MKKKDQKEMFSEKEIALIRKALERYDSIEGFTLMLENSYYTIFKFVSHDCETGDPYGSYIILN